MKHLGRYVEAKPWYTVGEIFDPLERPRTDAARGAIATVLTPAGNPLDISGSSRGTFELSEPGFYEVRTTNQKAGEGAFVAVNVEAAESDLASFDPVEFVAAVSAPGAGGESGFARELTAEDHERRQSLWWYLLAGGLLLLAIEAFVASRYPRIAQG
jgi:hypothetical protein